MKNLDHNNYTEARIKKIGYIVICYVLGEIIVNGKRIAFYRELKGLKKLVDPFDIDLEHDTELLRILNEPHVKLASSLADAIRFNVLRPYALLNLLGDEDVLEDELATETGILLFCRFIFFRIRPRRKDRYINFSRSLLSAQRTTYEFLKLMVTGETSAFDIKYRSDYSPGRLKALIAGSDDRSVAMLATLIDILKEYELESRDLTLKNNFL